MTTCRYKNAAVLMGGPGSEREVSLRSGAAVAAALRKAGLTVHELDVQTLDFTVPHGTEAVFPVLHGEFGEDGMAQRRLEELGLPYAGSRSQEMPRSFDKEITHALLAAAGVPMPPWEMLTGDQLPSFEPPLVLKAPRQGSSLGLAVVQNAAGLEAALKEVRQFDSRILVEKFIPGRECTVGFLGDDPLPLVEILPAEGTYDYRAKYERGDTRYEVPASFSASQTRDLQDLALQAYRVLGGRHLGRVDLRVDPEGTPFVLELNPLPGFTATSLLPKAAKAAGMDFQTLCVRILNQAELG